jgi:hypothetical protein
MCQPGYVYAHRCHRCQGVYTPTRTALELSGHDAKLPPLSCSEGCAKWCACRRALINIQCSGWGGACSNQLDQASCQQYMLCVWQLTR